MISRHPVRGHADDVTKFQTTHLYERESLEPLAPQPPLSRFEWLLTLGGFLFLALAAALVR